MISTILKKYGDKLLFVLAITVLATALIRFGIRRPVTSRAVTSNIVFTQWWENYLGKDTLLELIKEFEDTHKGIKITLNSVSYEELHGKLLDANDETAPSDIVALDSLWVPELVNREIIELAPNYSLDTPLLHFINVLYYNVDLLKEAGFSRPPKNRSEFTNYSKTLSAKEKGRWALTWGGNSSRGVYDDIFPWIWSAGAELIKDGKPALNSRPVIDTLSFLSSLESSGYIVPDGFSAGAEKKLDDFISGRAAFMIAPARDIEFVRNQMEKNVFDITSIPTPDNHAGKTYNAYAGWTLGIYAGSAHKEEARLFADFITGKAQALSEKAGATPENSAPDPLYSKVWDIAIAAENAQDFTGLPWEKLEKAFNEELSALFAMQSSPAETAGVIQKSWEAVISSD